MKNCPFCAEEIQDAAVLCRFCQSQLPKTHVHAPAPLPSVPAEDPGLSTVGLFVKVALASIAIIGVVVVIVAMAERKPTAQITIPAYTLVAQLGPMYRFVVVTPEQIANESELWKIADDLAARSSNGVNVMFWNSTRDAARGIPMDDQQLATMEAQIWINKTTHLREFKRRPFADKKKK